MMRIDVFDRHDKYLSTIAPAQLISAIHTDELNGEDSLTVSTTYPLGEGMRLVWRDRFGSCHEHICQDPKGASAAGIPVYTDTALSSICELFGDYIEDKRPHSYSFTKALEVALEPTRWSVGTVDQPGAVSSGMTFYHVSAREALQSILECGGELECGIEVGDSGVTRRTVSIRKHRGASDGHRRFAYGKDVQQVTKTEHWGAITACYGYGKGVETDAGGYGRKLTFGDINGGKDYVEDAAALKAYGRPDGKGGHSHVFGKYEDSECEDAQKLMNDTRAYLDAHKVPGVTYEAEVVDLVAMGRDWEGVGVGDDVQIVDSSFSPTLRCEGRVTKLVTDLLGGTQAVTLGNVTETMADIWQDQQSQIKGLQQSAGSWDAASSTTPAFLEQLVASLNARFNMNGMSYTYTSFEDGTIWSSVPLDEDGRPTKTGSAIQMCSQGFRIAAGLKPDGTFDWRTFGTGEGFVADLITVGSLDASIIKTGILSDSKGLNYIDFDTGACRLAATATVGGREIATKDAAIRYVDVEYASGASQTTAPTSGWSTTAPAWTAGKYIWQRTKTTAQDGSATYSDPTCIQGATGEQGVGIESIIEQYYLSGSSTSLTGGSWSSDQPQWAKYKYIWTRSRITWEDRTVTFTEPVLARALNGANQSASEAKDSVTQLDDSLTQREIFNRLTNNGQTQGIYLSGGKLYLNGEYIKAGTVVTDRLQTSRGSDLYAKIGTTANGNPGASFHKGSYDYLDIEAMYATEDPTQATSGVGLSVNNKGFLSANRYYTQTWITTPYFDDYIRKPNEQLYLRSGSGSYVELQRNEDQGVFFGDGWTKLSLDKTHYIYINSTGVQCRCGSKGFGWDQGRFFSELIW